MTLAWLPPIPTRNEAKHVPYRTFAQTAVGIQRQNTKLVLGVFEGSVMMLAGQARMTQVFLERSRTQQEAFRTSVEGPFRAYASLVYGAAPVKASKAGEVLEGLPVDDYDRLSVEELGRRLEGLCVRDVERLKAHERRTRKRRHVMERLDRSLV